MALRYPFPVTCVPVTTVTLQDGVSSLDSYLSQMLDWTGNEGSAITMCSRFRILQMRGDLDGSLWSGSIKQMHENNFWTLCEKQL